MWKQLGIEYEGESGVVRPFMGGSMLAPDVWEAMEQANQYFTNMPDLLDQTGARVAELMGAEAGRITPGASAAIALSVSACMPRGSCPSGGWNSRLAWWPARTAWQQACWNLPPRALLSGTCEPLCESVTT